MTMHAVAQQALIEEVAKDLRKLIGKPDWAEYAKTGVHKERPPSHEDWWYLRAASVLRTVYLRGPVGVSKLRAKYGGRKDRGVKPSVFAKGSGSVIRRVFQELEQAGLVKQGEQGVHKGRVITPKGASLLFSAAKRISPKPKQSSKRPVQKKPVAKEGSAKKPVAKKESAKKPVLKKPVADEEQE
ncbi:30S ribosomal protein S19e [Candidatus Woesearchaeota archaeon]|nr:30S ribosomal protein S19e [Candidatus Woesearchaeota archaeon]